MLLVLVGPDELADAAVESAYKRFPCGSSWSKERNELPNYLQVFDVALMPWVLSTGHVRSAIHSSFTSTWQRAGHRSCCLAELQPYRHLLRIAETYDGFISYIREALSDYDPRWLRRGGYRSRGIPGITELTTFTAFTASLICRSEERSVRAAPGHSTCTLAVSNHFRD
jgi:hypothetical protein